MAKGKSQTDPRSWDAVPIPDWMKDYVSSMGFRKMTAVQASCLPQFLDKGKDVVVEVWQYACTLFPAGNPWKVAGACHFAHMANAPCLGRHRKRKDTRIPHAHCQKGPRGRRPQTPPRRRHHREPNEGARRPDPL